MNIPEQIGNYTLDREIGSGASSQVWLARHSKLPERLVAVKLLMSQDREAIRRFQREASIAVRLRHANIVQLYDYGYTQPFFYTLLEYIPGGSLRQLIEKQGALPLEAALRIFRQIAAGLDHAHSLGVVHRDVSPGNILIEQETGRALLTDFGIAREAGQSITIANAIMGTPGFFSPEHVQGAQAVTHLSDLFSLGVVLYHMLSGQLPWDELPGISENPGFSPPIPLRQRGVENVPSAIDRVLLTMLAIDPAKRFPSARAAVEELDRIFSRHQMTTQIIPGADAGTGSLLVDFQSSGVEPNDVETLLGPALIRAPIDKAHRRAEEMRSAETIAAKLNDWSAQHRLGLRRRLLGRLAHLHKVSSANLYSYHLRLLYEQRQMAEDDEEPDLKAESFPLMPQIDRWKVELPAISDFSDHPGDRVILPGSTRVITCRSCHGRGVNPCPRCHGKQRVMITRQVTMPVATSAAPAIAAPPPSLIGSPPMNGKRSRGTAVPDPAQAAAPATPPPRTEQVLVPCPDCSGRGGITCEHCQGAGRLIQRKTFQWQRRNEILQHHDTRPAIDERWLHRTCRAEVIYRERQEGGLRPEWASLGNLTSLLAQAQEHTNADTRITMSELTISFIPVTDILFDLGRIGEENLYRLTIYGFENVIPDDWRFFNWERVITLCIITFCLITSMIFAYFAFFF
ncbi:MAG: protein kinase [Oscillochloris sp.]|nr:protein kinase [Oscillochloris sp.]